MAQLNNELAEKELLKHFRHENTWLQELASRNNWVHNNVIKIPRRGTAPDVLIDNMSYPISSSGRSDDFITRSLFKYDTENTDVTEDEIYALAYEKINDVQRQHREQLEDFSAEHALWNIAPENQAVDMPFIETTGSSKANGKMLTTKDLIRLWEHLSDLKVPLQNRVLVLSTEHAADLLVEDSGRERSWGNINGGLLTPNHVGFKLYTTVYGPTYKKVDDEHDDLDGLYKREAFGSVDVTAKRASICFHKSNAVKATGDVQRFAKLASENPEYRKNTIGFRLWFGAFRLMNAGFGGVITGNS